MTTSKISPGYSRVSPGLYKDRDGRLWRFPQQSQRAKDDKKKKNDYVRGREVAARDSASSGQVIYGLFRVGGAYSFIDTNSDTKAFLTTGTANSKIVFLAKVAGSAGNEIQVEMWASGTAGSTSVSVPNYPTDKLIRIRLRSNSSTPLATANEVINAVNAHPDANDLVRAHKGDGDGNAVVETITPTNLSEGGGTKLYSVLNLACHEIHSVEKLILDKNKVQWLAGNSGWAKGRYDKRVYMQVMYGTDTQAAQEDLIEHMPTKWSVDHRLRGWAYAYLQLSFNSNSFPEGIPSITFEVKGKKVYDPRSGLTVWTDNAALIAADYLTNEFYGLGVPYSRIDEAALIDAADVCDETITLADSTTESRYTINTAFDANTPPRTILEEMATAMGGDIIYQGGKWRILPGKWRAPTFTVSDADFVGDRRVQTLLSRREMVNTIRGTFASKKAEYVETDFPVVKNETYKTQDGEEIADDISLNMVVSPAAAQRLAKIELERRRQSIVFDCSLRLRAIQCEVGEVINVISDRYGWTAPGKAFEVRQLSIQPDVDVGLKVQATLRETASGVYAWNNGEETQTDLAPNTDLPSVFSVTAPTNLEYSSGTAELIMSLDGTIRPRLRITWDPTTDIFVQNGGKIVVDFKLSTDSIWRAAGILGGEASSVYITDVVEGSLYDVRVGAENAVGAQSEWSYLNGALVVGKLEKPSNVTGFSYSILSTGVYLRWDTIPDLDAWEYEVRLGASWEVGQFIARGQFTNVTVAPMTAATHYYWVRAIDTSGNYSTTATQLRVDVASPASPVVTARIDAEITLSWPIPDSDFQIESYSVRYGSSFGSSTLIAVVTDNRLVLSPFWLATQTFWVVAKDVAGNESSPGTATVSLQVSGQVSSISVDVVDNNVLLRWTEPTSGSLPIDRYKVLKGATFGSAVPIGEDFATFAAIFESAGGTYTYWVVAIDSAGNLGVERSITAVVNQPPDFVLRYNSDLNVENASRLSDCLLNGQSEVLFAPKSGRNFQDHFTVQGYTTIQQFISNGYNRWCEPSEPTAGTYEQIVDLGAVLTTQNTVTFSFNGQWLSGSGSATPSIAVSADGISYTTYLGVTSAYVSNFRYIKVILEVDPLNDKSIFSMQGPRVKVDVKEVRDGGGPVTVTDTTIAKTVTISIASPGVFTSTAHGFANGTELQLTTTGALPTGLTTATSYYVRNATANTFELSTTPAGGSIATSGSQSGTHTANLYGTWIPFTKNFVDVDSIIATASPTAAQGSTNFPWTAIAIFRDVPNPKGFYVQVYDRTGARKISDVRWSAQGV